MQGSHALIVSLFLRLKFLFSPEDVLGDLLFLLLPVVFGLGRDLFDKPIVAPVDILRYFCQRGCPFPVHLVQLLSIGLGQLYVALLVLFFHDFLLGPYFFRFELQLFHSGEIVLLALFFL